MRRFEELNPWTVLLWFICTAVPVMLIKNPLFILLSLAIAIALRHIMYGERIGRDLFFSGIMTLSVGMINMLFSHNGVTAILIVNNNRLTLEALFYGMAAGGMLSAVFMWFGLMNRITDTDRILYLTGNISPKLALTISMAMRYVSLIGKQTGQVRMALKASGEYGDGNGFDRIRAELKVFSCMTGWVLENGIITADSMIARGYMTGKRSSFSIYGMTQKDLMYMGIIFMAAAALTAAYLGLGPDFSYYPRLTEGAEMFKVWPVLLLYFLYASIPVIGRKKRKGGKHERISD